MRKLLIKKDRNRDTKIEIGPDGEKIIKTIKHRFLSVPLTPLVKQTNIEWINEVAELQAILKISHYLLRKHPELQAEITLLQPSLSTVIDFFKPAADHRYKSIKTEWLEIFKIANEYSYRKAVRDTAITNIQGKNVGLSYRYAKEKGSEMIKKVMDLVKAYFVVESQKPVIFEIVNSEKTTKREFEKWLNHYRREWYKTADSFYRYKRFYVRHYDSKLYAKQKEEFKGGQRKTRPTGKVECGPFLRHELPNKNSDYGP